MKIIFEAKFAKDLRTIKDGKILAKIKSIIIGCQQAESLTELNNVKKNAKLRAFLSHSTR